MRNERTQKQIDAGRKEKEKKARETGERKRWIKRKGMVQRTMVKPRSHVDSSWYSPHWHGKSYGLVKWIRGRPVELVPYLCAVSLSSSCDEFSELKCMSRGTPLKTLQSGSSRNFAHVNKFSIIASDDDEFTGEGCTPMHTSISQCQQRKCGAERVDACRRGDERVDSPRIRHIEVERTSGLVSCGVRRRQQRSPSREWVWLEKIERDHGLGIC